MICAKSTINAYVEMDVQYLRWLKISVSRIIIIIRWNGAQIVQAVFVINFTASILKEVLHGKVLF